MKITLITGRLPIPTSSHSMPSRGRPPAPRHNPQGTGPRHLRRGGVDRAGDRESCAGLGPGGDIRRRFDRPAGIRDGRRPTRYLGVTTVNRGTAFDVPADEALIHARLRDQGEGERSFPLMVSRSFSAKRDTSGVPGLRYLREGKVVHNPIDPSLDINDLPTPDISLIAGGIFKKHRWTNRVIPIQTTPGMSLCSSAYLSVTRISGGRMRYRDVDVVHIDYIRKYMTTNIIPYSFTMEQDFRPIRRGQNGSSER